VKIAITGIGIISAIGRNQTETLASLQMEKSGIGTMQHLHSVHTDLPVGEVKFSNEELRTLLQLPQSEAISRTSLLGLSAAREALQQAGITDVQDMAFISGTTVGGMDTTECCWEEWKTGQKLEYIAQHEAGASTLKIAEHIGDFAYTTTPSTACSSALNAIMIGANMLRTKKVSCALVGGTECLSKFHLNGFNTLMILDHQPCRPFDATRAGLNLGEGAAYLVIEPEEQALERGASILGYIAGYGNACDAFHQTASSEDGEGAFLAMNKALQMAHVGPAQVNYLNAHGTGTPNNDASESTAIHRLFGEKLPLVSSTKSFTGHTTSASGSIETAICLLCMQNDFVPANLNWTKAENRVIQPLVHNRPAQLEYVLCNSFGFGGNNSSLLLSKTIATDFTLADPSTEICYSDLVIDADYKQYVSPVEARRMTSQTRQALAVALKALGNQCQPDAIICATQYGCMHNSVVFLNDMLSTHEMELKPTPFIQSTHNTIASMVAIKLRNHGYNITYSHGTTSWQDALLDVNMQMQLGMLQSALIIEFDEYVSDWDDMLQKVSSPSQNIAKAQLLTIKR
jgi:3-oxoacyl-(acyl-carrier-protein) synthase